ncbi:1-phosphofructokinase family hexose kinase [Rhodohalobacter sp. 8-1]|uniref:1-phosphofructokinase family hexose kinase n=1 Tax=Rhodohalobacter sp. 8-1 TaxID=3131972 RepID=UPI0030ED44FE
MSRQVLTVTMNPALDVNSKAGEVVTDQKVRCEKPVYDPGGGGINVARVLKRLKIGADAKCVVGGVTGDLLKSLLKQEKINFLPVEIEQATRESISIIDNKTDKQYRFVFPGPQLEKNIWKRILSDVEDTIEDYEFVVASGSLPPGVPDDFYSRLAEIVLKNDKKYILDTSGDALYEGIKSGASYIKPNEEEFDELMNRSEAENRDELIDQLSDNGVENIIHTLGKDGTMLYNREGKQKFTPPEIEVNSSIGAGDSFVGGLVAGLTKDLKIEDAVYFGVASAASTLQSPGTSLCDSDEVKKIHAKLSGNEISL